jgi:glycosyltransferase involved in cell wall biosynthesis
VKLVPSLSPETLLVGATSELHKVKGLDVLLVAWSEFKKGRNAKLVIMGEGEERESLQNMAQQLGISDSVVFSGFVNNARTYLSALDIFVMPSLSENLPYSILEAGLARLPVIATAVGGIPEIIESGRNGILVLKEDPESLLSALIKLSEDRSLAKHLSEALHKTIKEKFSLEQMVDKTLEIYS